MTTDQSVLQKTPLYESHTVLGAKIAPFGGWLMPIQYEGILAEHEYTRKAVTVFDICHMGEFIIEGDAVLSGLDRVITQNIVSMPIGSCRYGFMLNEGAGVLDDLVVYRLEKDSWMLVVNAATIAGDETNLRKYLSKDAKLENISAKTGKLDIQGPDSLEALRGIFGDGVTKLKYYTFDHFTFGKESCIISRTGYTGELGFEIYISADHVVELWDFLLRRPDGTVGGRSSDRVKRASELKDKRIKPAGLGCRDTLRLEMGYPLYGHDLDLNHTPLSAGFAKFVDLSKDFVGKVPLLAEQKNGAKEHLVCFKANSRRAPRHGFAIFDGHNRVGTVTSGSFSPSLQVGIGMGYVSGNYKIGDQLLIKDSNIEIPVNIVKKPFYIR